MIVFQHSSGSWNIHLELEDKIGEIANREKYSFALVFCGDGFKWHRTQLEDFADFYRTGRHRPDDPVGKMELHDMNDKGQRLQRTISCFCYLERPLFRIEKKKFVIGVHGWPIFQ